MTVSDDIGSANAGTGQRHGRRLDLRTVLSNLLFGTRFVTIWIAMAVLLRRLQDRRSEHALVGLVERRCCRSAASSRSSPSARCW